jgi:hypothetical protein
MIITPGEVSYLEKNTNDLPESRFQEEKGPVNYTPNSSFFVFLFFFKFLEFEDHSVVDVPVRETDRYSKQHFTSYLVIET